MPSGEKKPIQWNSISELNTHTEVKMNIKTALQCKQYCKSANDIYKKAEALYQSGDEENAYILYMRYFYIVQNIKKTYEYAKAKNVFNPILAQGDILRAVTKAEELQKSLDERYAKKQVELQNKKQREQQLALERQKKEENDKKPIKPDDDVGLILPDVPDSFTQEPNSKPAEPLNKKDENNSPPTAHNNKTNGYDTIKQDIVSQKPTPGYISVFDFYNLIKENKNDLNTILLVDIRPREEYTVAKISHSCSINIPTSLLQPGSNINSIERKLSKDTWAIWITRSEKKYLIIMDYDFDDETCSPTCSAYILQDIICKFDGTYQVLILTGGFKQWHLHYPSMTTNPQYSKQVKACSESASVSIADKTSISGSGPKFATVMDPSLLLQNLTYPELPMNKPSSATSKDEIDEPKSSLPTDSQPPNDTNTKIDNINKVYPDISSSKHIDKSSSHEPEDKLSQLRRILSESDNHENTAPVKENKLPLIINNEITNLNNNNKKTEKAEDVNGQIVANSSTVSNNEMDSNLVPRTRDISVPKQTIPKQNIPTNSKKPLLDNESTTNGSLSQQKSISIEGVTNVPLNVQAPVAGAVIPPELKSLIKSKEELVDSSKPPLNPPNLILSDRQVPNQQDKPMTANQRVLSNSAPIVDTRVHPNNLPKFIPKPLDTTVPSTPHVAPPDASNKQTIVTKSINNQLRNQETKQPTTNATPQPKPVAKPGKPTNTTGQQPSQQNTHLRQAKSPHTTAVRPDPTRNNTNAHVNKKSVIASSPPPQLQQPVVKQVQKEKYITTFGLPKGWEKAINHETGRMYYKDHNTQTTHWVLPAEIQKKLLKNEVKSTDFEEAPKEEITKKSVRFEDDKRPAMKRSFSSPNLAEIEDSQKVTEEPKTEIKVPARPVIDRSVKPKEEKKVFADRSTKPVSRSRLQHLNPIHGGKGPCLTGLKNLGNTCYMNSVIQCLSCTTPLAKYFYASSYEQDLNKRNMNPRPTEMARELAFLMGILTIGQYGSISPIDFKLALGRFSSQFSGREQQDSHELLMYLLDGLHEDVNKVKTREQIKERDDSNRPDNIVADLAWADYLKNSNSVIVDLFQGQFRSTVVCLSCNKKSKTFDAFNCLQLELPQNRSATLEECIKMFTKPERIGGNDGWKCPHCKCYRTAEKTIEIWKMPKILIVQLKRFRFDGRWRNKIQTSVNFPLTNFNTLNYLATGSVSQFKNFNLYGIINHYGTFESGHYTAYCKNPHNSRWYTYDDNIVKDMDASYVKTNAAYLLFYTAVDFKSCL